MDFSNIEGLNEEQILDLYQGTIENGDLNYIASRCCTGLSGYPYLYSGNMCCATTNGRSCMAANYCK